MRILLTGVGKGFGRSYLEHLIKKDNFEIIGITRDLKDFNKNFFKTIKNKKVTLKSIDLSCSETVNLFIKKNKKILQNVDILINNAGQRYRAPVNKLDFNSLENLFRANVITPMILSKSVLFGMRKRRFGRIINISSILGSSGLPDVSGYSATKGAIDSMTRSMAVEFAKFGITINAIAPGFCETSYAKRFKENKKLNNEIINRIPMSRWGAKDEINGALDFLISKKSSYITGHILKVDGGWCS